MVQHKTCLLSRRNSSDKKTSTSPSSLRFHFLQCNCDPEALDPFKVTALTLHKFRRRTHLSAARGCRTSLYNHVEGRKSEETLPSHLGVCFHRRLCGWNKSFQVFGLEIKSLFSDGPPMYELHSKFKGSEVSKPFNTSNYIELQFKQEIEKRSEKLFLYWSVTLCDHERTAENLLLQTFK